MLGQFVLQRQRPQLKPKGLSLACQAVKKWKKGETMKSELLQGLFQFVADSPTAMHTVHTAETLLKKEGYERLEEHAQWQLKPNGRYYVVRGMSTIAAFQYPGPNYRAYAIVAPHGDAPCFRVKGDPEMKAGPYVKLNTEVYGGMPLNLWLDRPLSVAGRVMVRTAEGMQAKLVKVNRDLVVIPSLAIHMNREVNNGVKLNAQVETLPLYGMEGADFLKLIAREAEVEKQDLLSYDLYLYNRQKGTVFGERGAFIACPKLDDLQCTYAALLALTQSKNPEIVNVCAVFDNEEIGSTTKQGACSTFLSDVLNRIALAAGKKPGTQTALLAGSLILSADNAHGVHPNAVEKSDPTNRCRLNGGIVIKNSTRYATDAVSEGIFRRICEQAGVPVQRYYNRSDQPGGSTLGNLLSTHVSVNTVDIGAAQLAMHSPYETAGAKDTAYLLRGMQAFYQSVIQEGPGGSYRILNAGGKPTETEDELAEAAPGADREEIVQKQVQAPPADRWQDIFSGR